MRLYDFFEEGKPPHTMDELVVVSSNDGDQFLFNFIMFKMQNKQMGLVGKRQQSKDGRYWNHPSSSIKFYNIPFDIASETAWGSTRPSWFYLPKEEANKIVHKGRGVIHGKNFGI